ncbi:MAG: hypothetical protein ACI8RD_004648 [Bacillariaceae sp.]|jgi:hypothetical protein
MNNSDLHDDDDNGSAFDNATTNNTTSSIPANTDNLHQQSSPPSSGLMDFAMSPPLSAQTTADDVQDVDLQQQQQQQEEPNEQEQQPQRQASINLLDFGGEGTGNDDDDNNEGTIKPIEQEQEPQPQRQGSINLLDFGGEGTNNDNDEDNIESTQTTQQQSPLDDILGSKPPPQQQQEQLLDIFASNNDTTSMSTTTTTTKRDSFAPVDPSQQQQSMVLDNIMMVDNTNTISPAAATTTVPKSDNEDPFGVFMQPTEPQSQQQQQPTATLFSDPFSNISTTSSNDSVQPSVLKTTDDKEKVATTTVTSSETTTGDVIIDATTTETTKEKVDVSLDKVENDDDDDDNKEEKKQDETLKVLPSSTTTTMVAPTPEPEISGEMFESVSLLDDIVDDNNEDETKQNQDIIPKTTGKEDQDASVRNDTKTTIKVENNENGIPLPVPVECQNEEKDEEQEQEHEHEQVLARGRSLPGSEVTKRFANFKNLAAGAVAGQTQRFQNVQVPQRFQNVQVPQRFSNVFGGGNKAGDDVKPPGEEQDASKTITTGNIVNNSQSSTPVPNSEVHATDTVSSEVIPSNNDESNDDCTSEKPTAPSANPESQSTNPQVPATIFNTNDSVGDLLEGSISDREMIPSENIVEANDTVNHETEKMNDVNEKKAAAAEQTTEDGTESVLPHQQQPLSSPIPHGIPGADKMNMDSNDSKIESDATTAHDVSKAVVDSSETNPINVYTNENTASSTTNDHTTSTSLETTPLESTITTESVDDSPPLAAEPERSDSATSSTNTPQPLQTISKPLPDTSVQVELLRKELHAAHTTIMQLQHHDDVEVERPGDAVMVEIQANLQKEMNRRAEAEEKARVVMAKSQTVGEEYKTFKIESTKNLDELTSKYEISNKEKEDMKKELIHIREERDEQARKEMALTTRLNAAKKKEAVKANAAEHYEEQVDQLESYIKDYKSQLETLTVERDQLQEELEEWKQYAEKRTKQLETALNDEKKLNNERKTKMKGFVEAKTEEVRSAKADYLSLQTELDQNTSSLTELNHRYKQLHAQWVQSQTRNRELQRDMMKIKKDSEKMNKVGGSLEARLSRSAQQSEDHKNKRIHARNELMSVLGQLEAERAVNIRLQESIKMTFTPKALSQQQTIQEALDDFEGALQKLSTRLGRPLAPNINDSMMGSSSVDNQSLNDDGSIGINSMNGTGEGDDDEEGSNISSGTVTLSEINTNRAVQKLENETQRVSRNVLAFSSSVERMNGLLDGAGTRNCVDAALSSILMMGGVGIGGGGAITNGNATPSGGGGGTNSSRRGSTRGGQRYGQVSANLT